MSLWPLVAIPLAVSAFCYVNRHDVESYFRGDETHTAPPSNDVFWLKTDKATADGKPPNETPARIQTDLPPDHWRFYPRSWPTHQELIDMLARHTTNLATTNSFRRDVLKTKDNKNAFLDTLSYATSQEFQERAMIQDPGVVDFLAEVFRLATDRSLETHSWGADIHDTMAEHDKQPEFAELRRTMDERRKREYTEWSSRIDRRIAEMQRHGPINPQIRPVSWQKRV